MNENQSTKYFKEDLKTDHFGIWAITTTQTHLVEIRYKKKLNKTKSYQKDQARPIILVRTLKELSEYFKGERKSFSIPYLLKGTTFQEDVWNALSKITYGKTQSYKDIALKVKRPKAFRAVGSANGKNKIPIIIPCHRVINASGELGGYAYGLDLKRKLLILEGLLDD